MKYSPPEAAVDIRVSATDAEVVVEVADRGPGLAKGEAHAVFEKLYRGSAAVGQARGAGLGLAIAQAVVQVHGGRIWATDRPGGGAIFAFALPLQQAPADLAVCDESGLEEEE